MPLPPTTYPDFGIYRAVIPEDVPRVRAAAELASASLSGYFAEQEMDIEARLRPDFGIVFASRRAVYNYMMGGGGQSFDFERFVSEINTRVRPAEVSPLPLHVVGGKIVGSRRRKFAQFSLERDEGYDRLREQRRGIRGALEAAGGGPQLQHPDHLGVLYVGAPNTDVRLPSPHFANASRLVAEVVVSSGLGTVSLGPLVIGTEYREPLPGTEWVA